MRRAAAPILAASAALLLGARGAARRDLAGDEQNMLHLPFRELLEQALQAEGPFWGHLPWSFALRALHLGLWGEGAPWAWRLHSLAAHAGLSALIAAAAARHGGLGLGLGLGLLAAAHPLLLFYAQDAGNYAWTAALLTGLALASPLGGRPARPLALGPLVALNLWNDLYSLPWLLGFAGLSAHAAWRRPGLRAPLASAWALGIGVGSAFLWPIAARLLHAGQEQLALHADPPPPRALPLALEVPLRVGLRALGSAAGGITEGRQRAAAAAIPPVVLALGLAGAGWARGGRPARALLSLCAAVLLLHAGAGVVAEAALDRALPHEPRVHIALPAMLLIALGWAAPALRWPRAAVLLAAPLLVPTCAEQAQLGALRRGQRAELERITAAEPSVNDVIFDDQTARWTGAPPRLRRLPCAADGGGGLVLWAFDHEPERVALPRCSAEAAPSLRVLRLQSRPPPAQERNSSSFQPTRSVALLGAALPPGSPLAGWRLRVEAGLPWVAGELRLVEAGGAEHGRWPAAALPVRLPPGALPPAARLQLVLTDGGAPAVELARSDALLAGEGGDWALWIDPLELPGPRRALRWAQLLGGGALLGLAWAGRRP